MLFQDGCFSISELLIREVPFFVKALDSLKVFG